MLLNLLAHFLGAVLGLAVFLAVGNILLSVFQRYRAFVVGRPFMNLFASAFIGSWFCILLFTVAVTGFKTFTMGMIPVFLWFLYAQRDRLSLSFKFTFSQIKLSYIFLFMLVALCLVHWEALRFMGDNAFGYNIPRMDYIFYGNISDVFNITGQENWYAIENILDNEYHGYSAYHYHEHWITSLFSFISGFPSMAVMILWTHPVINLMIIFGFLSIAELYGKVKGWHVLFLSSLLFLGGNFFDLYRQIPYLANVENLVETPMTTLGRKLGPYYLYYIATFLLLYFKKYLMATVTIMSIGIATVTAFPGVVIGTFLFVLLSLWRKEINLKLASQMLAVWFSFVLYVALCSAFFGGGVSNLDYSKILNIENFLDLDKLRTRINIMLLTPIQFTVVYIPFLIAVAVLWRKRLLTFIKLEFFQFGLLIIVGALFGWMIVYEMIATYQVFSNTSQSLLNVLFAIVIISFVMKMKSKKALRMVVIIALPLFYNFYTQLLPIEMWYKDNTGYQTEYLESVKKELDSSDEHLGAYFRGPSDYTGYYEKYSRLIIQGVYTKYSKPYISPLCMSVHDIGPEEDPRLDMMVKYDVESNLFYRYVEACRDSGQTFTIDEYKLNFILKHNLAYAIFSKAAKVPKEFESITEKVIVDSKSGERMVIFKK